MDRASVGAAQFHGLAVGGVAVGVRPRLLAVVEGCGGAQPAVDDEPFERGDPVVVVPGPVVLVQPRASASASSSASVRAHSFQVKCPSSESFTARAKACACHGASNTRALVVRGQGRECREALGVDPVGVDPLGPGHHAGSR